MWQNRRRFLQVLDSVGRCDAMLNERKLTVMRGRLLKIDSLAPLSFTWEYVNYIACASRWRLSLSLVCSRSWLAASCNFVNIVYRVLFIRCTRIRPLASCPDNNRIFPSRTTIISSVGIWRRQYEMESDSKITGLCAMSLSCVDKGLHWTIVCYVLTMTAERIAERVIINLFLPRC